MDAGDYRRACGAGWRAFGSAAMIDVHDLSALRALARRLKVPEVDLRRAEKRLFKHRVPVDEVLAALTQKLTDLRTQAMAAKDFSAVDALKAALTEAGVEVRMSKTGVELIAGPRVDAKKLGTLL